MARIGGLALGMPAQKMHIMQCCSIECTPTHVVPDYLPGATRRLGVSPSLACAAVWRENDRNL